MASDPFPQALIKNENKKIVIQKEWVPPPDAPPSIDLLMAKGLTALERTLNSVLQATNDGRPPQRDDILNLRDCMSMLHDLKAKEQELLESLSDEDLERISKNSKTPARGKK